MKTLLRFLFLLLVPACAAAQAPGAGRALYESGCASCHGMRADGDGWLAVYLKQPPTPLTRLSRSYGGAFPRELVRQVVDGRRDVKLHGPRDMPIWGENLRGAGMDALLDYLESIQE